MEDMVVHGTIVSNMPELPEVETVKRLLASQVLGKHIMNVDVLRSKNIEGDAKVFSESLIDCTIESISRRGKFLIFHFDNNLVLISHLRMEGKYFYYDKITKPTKHDLVLFGFEDNTSLFYNDTRRFGTMKLSTEDKYLKEPPLSNLGPDANTDVSVKYLKGCLKNKRIPIKQALLDQSIIAGLGNIYVDEVLFLSKIHPLTPANRVDEKSLKLVLANAKIVLNKAIDAGGSTIKSYHPGKGIDGNFQSELNVYGKKNEICPICGATFRKIFVNGRGTTFCPHCQKNVALPHVVAITGPIGSGKSLASEYFRKHGYDIFDADACVHALYERKDVQERVLKLVKELNGKFDKKALKDDLVKNKKEKQKLEDYLYRLVDEEAFNFIKSHKEKDNVVLEVPLLFQSHICDYADEIYILSIDKKNQKERLQSRNINIDEYLKLNESYYLQEDKKKATAVISNDGDVASLYSKLDKIICDK